MPRALADDPQHLLPAPHKLNQVIAFAAKLFNREQGNKKVRDVSNTQINLKICKIILNDFQNAFQNKIINFKKLINVFIGFGQQTVKQVDHRFRVFLVSLQPQQIEKRQRNLLVTKNKIQQLAFRQQNVLHAFQRFFDDFRVLAVVQQL